MKDVAQVCAAKVLLIVHAEISRAGHLALGQLILMITKVRTMASGGGWVQTTHFSLIGIERRNVQDDEFDHLLAAS